MMIVHKITVAFSLAESVLGTNITKGASFLQNKVWNTKIMVVNGPFVENP